ncbi:alpha/beta hydrolase [Saccharomonospora sp. CUA-673]|uniref:alpha/beta hydrolase n=1 Tax=Saccharomonospora sp. CUA-673 TaxID=1904969 RepID=UPI0009F9BC15|nr:alpha/beta hydrolase [Saccharomonospora sp. CUA-673]
MRQWSGDPLGEAVGALNREYNELIAAGEDLGKIGTPEGWSGEAAQAAGSRCGELVESLGEWTAEIAAVRKACGAASDAIGGVKNGVTEAEELAKANNFSIADDGAIRDQGPPADTPDAQQQAVAEERAKIKSELDERVSQVLRSARDIDSDLCAVLDKVLSSDTIDADSTATSLSAAGHAGAKLGALSIPTPPLINDATAAQNAAWWATLSDAQRKRFAQDYPRLVGPRDGLDTTTRSSANMTILRDEREKLRAERKSLKEEMGTKHGPGGQLERSSLERKIENIDGRIKGLNDIENKVNETKDLDDDSSEKYFILQVDSEGDGTAAVSRGNPDTAQYVSTFVPGTGSELGNIDSTMDRSERMAEQARWAGAESTATISWHGYDAPDEFANATSGTYAEEAEPKLAKFQDGLLESRDENASERHNTLVGHSYGATTIGKTAQNHEMPVDDLVLVGSPGVDAPHVSDLQIPEGHVWATADENDPVAEAPVFDIDPTEREFGANVFGSSSDSEGKWYQGGYNLDSHSDYWDYNNPALEKMGKIIAGQS